MNKQEEYLALVQKLAKKYTHNESSSIRYETASELLSAILYCVREAEQHEGEALAAAHSTLEEQYEFGYELVVEKTKKMRAFHSKLLDYFQGYDNEAYEKTVIDGMQKFFLYYDPKFRPMDHLLTLDYPTLSQYGKRSGIDLIECYLKDIAMEQKLLQQFPYEYVMSVLSAYAIDHKQLIFNLPSVVLVNAAGALICRKKLLNYGYTAKDYELLYEKLTNVNELDSLIEKTFQLLFDELLLQEEQLEYFKPVVEELKARIQPAVTYRHLDKLFLI